VKPDLLRTFRLLMAPIKTRVLLMISRAIVRIVMDDKKMQQVQITVLQDEVLDNVERFQNFGFTSNPLTGAEAVLACVGGDRSHPIVIVVDDRRHRKLNLQPGEAAIYNAFGDYALLKADGTFEVVASTKVMITSPLVEMSANLKVDGNLQVLGTSVQLVSLRQRQELKLSVESALVVIQLLDKFLMPPVTLQKSEPPTIPTITRNLAVAIRTSQRSK
jgi:phage baseplate assembly protein V